MRMKTTHQKQGFGILAVVLGLVLGASAMAGEKNTGAFPAKFADFEKLTFAQMKALPDLKWSLDKIAQSSDLAGKSETELVLLRNSIYAQYGFGFGQKGLANYFLSRGWYEKRSEEADLTKLTKEAQASVGVFLKAQAAFAGGSRDVASTKNEYEVSQIAYNLFLMGFCTYEVNGDSRAGMVVFEPGGVAKVFHSKASRAGAIADYAYEEYAKPESAEYGSLLVDANWSISVSDTKSLKKGVVTISYPKDTVTRILDYKKRPILDEAKRQVLTVSFGNGEYSPNRFPWVKTKKCSMTKLP